MNYGRKLRIGADIRRKRRIEKIIEFTERMKKVQKEVGATLRKTQKETRQQTDRRRKEVKEWKKGDKVEYKGLGIQRETGKEASGLIYQSIFH